MPRIRLLATTTTVAATLGLAVTGVASAGPAKVTGLDLAIGRESLEFQ